MIIELTLDERTWIGIALYAKIDSATENFKRTNDEYWSSQVESLKLIADKL